MRSYPIHELERLTGIKAHTIRIWEKRYGLIAPARTTTNRRAYDDEQLKKLLNVRSLLARGNKISKIAELSEDALRTEILKDIVHAPAANEHDINKLTAAMLAYDEAGFARVFDEAVSRLGLYEAFLLVVYPFLGKVGVLWTVSDAAPAQEHFASGIIRRKLMAATDALPILPAKEKLLLLLPEGEWHDIGLLFANYILRTNGYTTYYLGQNVPADNVQKTVAIVKPDHLLVFYIATRPGQEIKEQLKAFSAMAKGLKVLVAGRSDLLPLKTTIGNVTYLTDVKDLLACLQKAGIKPVNN